MALPGGGQLGHGHGGSQCMMIRDDSDQDSDSEDEKYEEAWQFAEQMYTNVVKPEPGEPGTFSNAMVFAHLYLPRGLLQALAALQDFWLQHGGDTQASADPAPLQLTGSMVLTSSQDRMYVFKQLIRVQGGWVVEVAHGPAEEQGVPRYIPIEDLCDTPLLDLDTVSLAPVGNAYGDAVKSGHAPATTPEQFIEAYYWRQALNELAPHVPCKTAGRGRTPKKNKRVRNKRLRDGIRGWLEGSVQRPPHVQQHSAPGGTAH